MDAATTPPLEPGLTYVEQPDPGAIHRLVLDADVRGGRDCEERRSSEVDRDERGDRAREVLWVDAGGAASTYGLTARTPTDGALRGIRIARAFTAHQHHEQVRRAVRAAGERTDLVVAPNVAALYDAADAADAAIDRLFRASLDLLADLASTAEVPVLVSAPGRDGAASAGGGRSAGGDRSASGGRSADGRRSAGGAETDTVERARPAAVRERAEAVIECRRTDLGYAFETDEFRTTGYHRRGWWQTTIPRWVELFGAVGLAPGERAARAAEPVVPPSEEPPRAGTAASATDESRGDATEPTPITLPAAVE